VSGADLALMRREKAERRRKYRKLAKLYRSLAQTSPGGNIGFLPMALRYERAIVLLDQ